MCLELYAVPAVGGRVSADRLERVSGLRVRKRRHPAEGALHFSRDGGCSCSLMTDDADWNASEWALEPSILTGLAAAIRLIYDEAGGFTLQAVWLGDQPNARERVALREVLKDVRGNRVKNRFVYLVGKAAG
jgi:hypothetical protein